MNISKRSTQRHAFTLVELVIVVLVLGIIAAAAAPKLFDTANDARDNSTRHSLVVLRNALELYRATNAVYPDGADMATELVPFLQGPFPSVQGGNNPNANIAASTDEPINAPAGAQGWIYNETTGEIRVNDASMFDW